MSELVQFTPEGEPFVGFSTQLGEIYATKGNSTLFLHGFEDAGADHLFVATGEDEDNYKGVFLWRVMMNSINPEFFEQLASELQDNDWDTLICDQVSENDQATFNKFVDSKTVKVTNKKIRRWLEDEQGAV